MNVECQRVQELLAESGGRTDTLPEDAVRHLGACQECARAAEQERELARLLAVALPPEDAALTERIMEAVGRRRRAQRLLRLLPLAASVLLVLGAAVLLGGVPGSGLLAAVPGTAVAGCLGLTGGAIAWVRSVAVAAGALASVVPGWVIWGAMLLVLGGLLVGRRLLRRLEARQR